MEKRRLGRGLDTLIGGADVAVAEVGELALRQGEGVQAVHGDAQDALELLAKDGTLAVAADIDPIVAVGEGAGEVLETPCRTAQTLKSQRRSRLDPPPDRRPCRTAIVGCPALVCNGRP